MSATTPTRNPRGEGGRLRTSLLANAAKLLDDGVSVDALSLRGIARESGVRAPSVYLHFDGKDALVSALLEDLFAQLGQAVAVAAPERATAEGQLRARCLAYCRFALEYPGRYRLMFSDPLPGAFPDGATLPGVWVLKDLRDAIGRCERADGPGADLAALMVWGGLHGLVSLRATRPRLPWPDLDEHVGALLASVGVSATGS